MPRESENYDFMWPHYDSKTDRKRVLAKLTPYVMEYARLHAGESFHAEDLRRYVMARVPNCAPASPDRCLRELREKGKLNYAVIDRPNSEYLFLPLPSATL